MNYWLLLIPVLTAFSGWITIHIIRFLLFKPVAPVKVFGISFQGMLPRHQQQIAEKLGRFAATEFSLLSALDHKLNDPKNFESIKPLVEAHMDDFLRNKLKEQMPMVGMFIGDKTIQSLKTIFIQEIEELFPRVMQRFAGNMQKELNIEQIIIARISAIPPHKLQQLVSQNLDSGYQKAYVLALAIGFLIGIIQMLLFSVVI